MPKKNHTKGEWVIKEESNHLCIYAENGKLIAQVKKNIGDAEGEAEANARLISAAPKLVQIAEMFYDDMLNSNKRGTIIWNVTEKVLKGLYSATVKNAEWEPEEKYL
ncbi:hypothetical protein [Leptobacterium sp. I13]|uniref:hypothetical protein n=1 Tax=Leptobacterium meishanense TaxID=3128904 RepID=UPI0030EC74C4